jgi:hypothetical protein
MRSKRFLNFKTRSRDCPNLKVYNIMYLMISQQYNKKLLT